MSPLPVAPEHGARLLVAAMRLPRPEVTVCEEGATPLHTAADRHVPKLATAFQLAFALGRKAIKPMLTSRKTGGVDRAVDAMREALDAVVPKMLLKVVAAGGKVGAERLDDLKTLGDFRAALLGFRFDVANPLVIAWARMHAAEAIKQVTDTTKERIRRAVEDFEADGDWDVYYDRVLDAIGDKTRADLISRHEAMTAASEGNRQAWYQAEERGLLDDGMRRVWLTVGDELVCPICGPLADKTAPLHGQYPGGFDGPPAHIRCRCDESLTAY
jgi:hypothetical protein